MGTPMRPSSHHSWAQALQMLPISAAAATAAAAAAAATAAAAAAPTVSPPAMS